MSERARVSERDREREVASAKALINLEKCVSASDEWARDGESIAVIVAAIFMCIICSLQHTQHGNERSFRSLRCIVRLLNFIPICCRTHKLVRSSLRHSSRGMSRQINPVHTHTLQCSTTISSFAWQMLSRLCPKSSPFFPFRFLSLDSDNRTVFQSVRENKNCTKWFNHTIGDSHSFRYVLYTYCSCSFFTFPVSPIYLRNAMRCFQYFAICIDVVKCAEEIERKLCVCVSARERVDECFTFAVSSFRFQFVAIAYGAIHSH